MQHTRALRVGISVLSAAAVLYFGVRYLKGSDLLSSSYHYYLKYPSTQELEVSNPVLINGIVVGQVDRLELIPETYFVEVRISVEKDIGIPRGTIAELQNSSLLGGKSITLTLPNERIYMHEDEDTLKARIKHSIGDLFSQPETKNDMSKMISNLNMFVESLSTSGELTIETLHQLDTIAISMNKLINANQAHVEHSMRQFSQMSERLNHATLHMDSLILELRVAIKDIDPKSMGEVVRGANSSVSEARLLLKSLREGEGTLGQLITNDQLYVQLSETLKQLSDLLDHLDNRPRDFLAPLGRRDRKVQKKKKRSN